MNICWCYWKIKNSKELINIDSIFTENISNERYKITVNNNLYGIFDKIKQKFLTYKDICKKLNRLEYYKGICFD